MSNKQATYTISEVYEALDQSESATHEFLKPVAEIRIRVTDRINNANRAYNKVNAIMIAIEEMRAKWIAFCSKEADRYFRESMTAYENGDDKGSEKLGNRSLDFSSMKHNIEQATATDFQIWHNNICDQYEHAIKQNAALPSAVARVAGFFNRNFGAKKQTA